MKPALSYCRVSTKSQQEEGSSLETQSTAIKELADSLSLRIGKEIKEVYTGAELYDRPGLTVIRDAIKTGEYSMLLCHSIDRLSRHPIHLGIIAMECDRAGVELRFVTEHLDNTPEGQLIQYVRGYAAQVEREKIRERSIRGRRAVLLSGKIHNAGSELYGYRRNKEKGVREVYEPEAAVIRRIFEMIVKYEYGTRAIARILNSEGIPSPSEGKRSLTERTYQWSKTEVARIISEESYKGVAFGWRYKSTGRKHNTAKRDLNERIKLPDHVVPAIVTAELWQSVQLRKEENRGERARNEKRQYLLRGYIYCSCGQRMYSEPTKCGRYYRCSSRDKATGPCGASNVRAEVCEEWVWEQVKLHVERPDLIRRGLEKRKATGKMKYLESDLRRQQQQLAKLETAQQKLLGRFKNDPSDTLLSVIETEIERTEKEKNALRKSIAELEGRLAVKQNSILNFKALSAYCEQVKRRLPSATFQQKRIALQAFGVKVHVSGRADSHWYMILDAGVADQTSACQGHNTIVIYYKAKAKRRKAA